MQLPRLLPLLWVIERASGDCITLPQEFRGTYPFLTLEYPSLALELQSVAVQEGLCVLVPCTVMEYPMNSDLDWWLQTTQIN